MIAGCVFNPQEDSEVVNGEERVSCLEAENSFLRKKNMQLENRVEELEVTVRALQSVFEKDGLL